MGNQETCYLQLSEIWGSLVELSPKHVKFALTLGS